VRGDKRRTGRPDRTSIEGNRASDGRSRPLRGDRQAVFSGLRAAHRDQSTAGSKPFFQANASGWSWTSSVQGARRGAEQPPDRRSAGRA